MLKGETASEKVKRLAKTFNIDPDRLPEGNPLQTGGCLFCNQDHFAMICSNYPGTSLDSIRDDGSVCSICKGLHREFRGEVCWKTRATCK